MLLENNGNMKALEGGKGETDTELWLYDKKKAFGRSRDRLKNNLKLDLAERMTD
jgi:hypothetical protein